MKHSTKIKADGSDNHYMQSPWPSKYNKSHNLIMPHNIPSWVHCSNSTSTSGFKTNLPLKQSLGSTIATTTATATKETEKETKKETKERDLRPRPIPWPVFEEPKPLRCHSKAKILYKQNPNDNLTTKIEAIPKASTNLNPNPVQNYHIHLSKDGNSFQISQIASGPIRIRGSGNIKDIYAAHINSYNIAISTSTDSTGNINNINNINSIDNMVDPGNTYNAVQPTSTCKNTNRYKCDKSFLRNVTHTVHSNVVCDKSPHSPHSKRVRDIKKGSYHYHDRRNDQRNDQNRDKYQGFSHISKTTKRSRNNKNSTKKAHKYQSTPPLDTIVTPNIVSNVSSNPIPNTTSSTVPTSATLPTSLAPLAVPLAVPPEASLAASLEAPPIAAHHRAAHPRVTPELKSTLPPLEPSEFPATQITVSREDIKSKKSLLERGIVLVSSLCQGLGTIARPLFSSLENRRAAWLIAQQKAEEALAEKYAQQKLRLRLKGKKGAKHKTKQEQQDTKTETQIEEEEEEEETRTKIKTEKGKKQEKQEEQEDDENDEKNDDLCVACMTGLKTHCFGCGHLCLCTTCVAFLPEDKCPICRYLGKPFIVYK